jgi:hypothetical protein
MRIIQFQVSQGAIYVLDSDGILWRNELGGDGPVSPARWKVVAVPSAHQHAIEHEQRYNIDHPERES